MTLKRITLAAVLVLLVSGAVLLWPNVEAILTLGAAVLLVGGLCLGLHVVATS